MPVVPFRIWVALLSATTVVAPVAAARADQDGFLRQKIGFLIYAPFGPDGVPGGANWILEREIGFFESYLWRASDRRVAAEPVILRPGRRLRTEEYLDAGRRWGYLPDFSPDIEADLRAAGWQRDDFSALVVLYQPAEEKDTPLAGATYLPAGISSVPLRPDTFLDGGRRHPLHRLLVHEYLHQMEFAFAATGADAYLFDPDTPDWQRCASDRLKDELQVALHSNATCSEIDWMRISPERGEWTGR